MMNIEKKLRPAVFLDRDGVLNRPIIQNGKPYAPRTLQDFEILPEASWATRVLNKAGYLLIVVTNQPDVGNQLVSRSIVEEMHQQLSNNLDCLDEIKVCYHAQSVGCFCRKPNPGMLLEAADGWHIDLKSSFMIGDRTSDIVAGIAAGCRTIFIDYQYLETSHSIKSDFTVKSIVEAVELIVR